MKKNVKNNLKKMLSMFVAFLMILTLITPKAALAGTTPPDNGEAMDGVLWIHKVLNDREGKELKKDMEFEVEVTGPSYLDGKIFKVTSGKPLEIKELKYGNYTVAELHAEDYDVTMKPADGMVEVGEKEAKVTIWNKEKDEVVMDDGMLTIHKIVKDSEGKVVTEPMTFEVHVTGPTYPEGEHFDIVNGTPLVLKDLKYGKYMVEETPVEGYKTIMDPENGKVKIGKEMPGEVTIWNKEKEAVVMDDGKLTIHKFLKDSEGNEITEPMTFKIKVTGPSYPEGEKFDIMNGTPLMLENLKYGEYKIVELDADGYVVTMYPKEGVITVGATPVALKIYNKEKEAVVMDDGVLTIHKYLQNNWGKTIEEVRTFKIKVTGPSYPEGEKFDIMNGTPLVLDDLKYGEYKIVELDADGYHVMMYPKYGVVTVGSTPMELKIWNKEKMVMEDNGMLTIIKYLKDSEGTLITEPMDFEIEVTGPSYPEGKIYQIANGTPLELKDLKYGKYTVVETAVEGYKTTMWPVNGEVWVGMHTAAILKIWNMEEMEEVEDNGVLWIHKYLMDSWGRPIKEAKEFTVKVTGPSYPEGEEFKVMSGTPYMLENLKYGEYKIVELDSDGYHVMMYPKYGAVTVGSTPMELKIWNKEKMVMEDKGMLTVIKYLKDSEGNLITEPMNFEIEVTGPSYPEGKIYQIANGTPLELKDLKYGKYTVVETAVEGYKTTMWPVNGEVWVGMHTAAILKIWNMEEMKEELGTLIIKKYLKDSEGELIDEEKEFIVTITGPSFPEGEDFTIKSGMEWKKEDLKYGEYTVVEKAMDGYEVTMDPATGKVMVSAEPVTLTIWNVEEEMEEELGTLIIKKYLKDSEGELIDEEKEFIVTITGPSFPEGEDFTIKSGVEWKKVDLKYGEYTVVEKAMDGYEVKMDPATGKVTICEEPVTLTIWNKEMEVEEVMGELVIHKVLLDNMGKPVTDVREFKIWVKGPSYTEWKEFTVKNGTDLVIKDLKLGLYEVKEVEAEDYDVKIGEILPLTEDHRSHTVTVTNMEEALGQLTIHKILKDEDGDVITAAKNFKIWVKGPSFPNGKEFTVKNGTPLVIKELVYGTYTVTEPGASDDYKVSIKQSPKLTITAKMGTATITNTEIEVEEVSPLPQTGGVSSSALYLMSSIMILGGLGLLRKKED